MSNPIKALDALIAMNVPAMLPDDSNEYQRLRISAEDNYGDEPWADYWEGPQLSCCDDFGVNLKINAVLEANGLFAEWINPGVLGVYDA